MTNLDAGIRLMDVGHEARLVPTIFHEPWWMEIACDGGERHVCNRRVENIHERGERKRERAQDDRAAVRNLGPVLVFLRVDADRKIHGQADGLDLVAAIRPPAHPQPSP